MSSLYPADDAPVPARLVYSHDSAPLWSAHEGHVASIGTYALCALFCWLVIPLFIAFVRYIRVKSHTYELTEQRLRERSGVFSRHISELELYRVRDISIEQPFLQRLFGCGRIVLGTSDRSAPLMVLEAIPDPLAVANQLREFVERCRVAKGVREFN